MADKTIDKNMLKGKYIEYIDKEGKHRINKVTKVYGNVLTVKDALKKRRRVHLDNVLWQIHHKHCKRMIKRKEK